MKAYEAIARAVEVVLNTNDADLKKDYKAKLDELMERYMPHGGGIDGETRIDYSQTPTDLKRLVISSSFHVMRDGHYTRWIHFTVVVTPDLRWGMNLDVRGQFGKDQDIKDHIAEAFHQELYNDIAVKKA